MIELEKRYKLLIFSGAENNGQSVKRSTRWKGSAEYYHFELYLPK